MIRSQYLFSGKSDLRIEWTLESEAIMEAASIGKQLLDEGRLPLLHLAIAKRKCGLAVDERVPDEWIETVTKIHEQVHDERDQIRDAIQSISDYRLVPCAESGLSSRTNGGKRSSGFVLSDSIGGLDDRIQEFKMMKGQVKSLQRRQPELMPPVTSAFITGCETVIKELEEGDD